MDRNSYRRPVQRVSSIIRTPPVTRPTVNLPIIPNIRSAFSLVIPDTERAPEIIRPQVMQASYLLMPARFTRTVRITFNTANQVLLHKPRCSSKGLQMIPPIMPEVAGYCPGCAKTYNQIAVETLTPHVAWSEYPEKTISDRNVHSRAFVDGFGAAFVCLKNAGLLPGYPCVQHR